MTNSDKSPAKHRQELAREIYQWADLTLPVSRWLLQHVFSDVTITLWAQCVGVAFTINKDPDPEWKTSRTITFRDVRSQTPDYTSYEDTDL